MNRTQRSSILVVGAVSGLLCAALLLLLRPAHDHGEPRRASMQQIESDGSDASVPLLRGDGSWPTERAPAPGAEGAESPEPPSVTSSAAASTADDGLGGTAWDGTLTAEQKEFFGEWAEPASHYRVLARGAARNLPRRIRRVRDGAYMVAVWCRDFIMGVGHAPDKNVPPDAAPDIRVGLTHAFYMDETEVTRGQWVAYSNSLPEAARSSLELAGPDLPVVGIAHAEALAFAKWAGVDLPTEAQWECAAKYDSVATYPYGAPESVGNAAALRYWTGRPADGPARVAQYPPNDFGIYDLGGNAAEWCRDVYRSDFYALQLGRPCRDGRELRIDPLCLEVGTIGAPVTHVVRGGSWFSPQEELRVFHRSHAGDEATGVGFRCVKLIPWEILVAPRWNSERHRP